MPDPGSDVELDEDDFAIFEDFGKRVDFLAAGHIGLKPEDVRVRCYATLFTTWQHVFRLAVTVVAQVC